MGRQRPNVELNSPVFDESGLLYEAGGKVDNKPLQAAHTEAAQAVHTEAAQVARVEAESSHAVQVKGTIHKRPVRKDLYKRIVEAKVSRYVDSLLAQEIMPSQKRPASGNGTTSLYESATNSGFCLKAKSTGKTYPVNLSLRVGRLAQFSDLAITENTNVSAKHAVFSERNGILFVKDVGTSGQGSQNGTFVNGTRIPPQLNTELVAGDTVKFANSDEYIVERNGING